MSIDEIRQRRLRESRVALLGMVEGTGDEVLMTYFGVPHHGTGEGGRHADLAPGSRLILEGDPNQPISYTLPKRPIVDAFLFTDTETSNRPHLIRPLRSALDFGFFFVFFSKQKRDSFIGDLEERYWEISKATGRRKGNRWFWRQVALSFFSLALDSLKKTSGLEWLFRRIIG